MAIKKIQAQLDDSSYKTSSWEDQSVFQKVLQTKWQICKYNNWWHRFSMMELAKLVIMARMLSQL